MLRSPQQEAFKAGTVLTIAGGATPSVTGQWLNCGASDGNVSLFLVNAGTSTSVAITYEFGYIKTSNQATQTITNITPEGGGTITNLASTNIPGSHKHEAISVDQTKWIRFNAANLDAVAGHTAILDLYVVFQEI
jgi:hypothetical protein